MTLYKGRYVIEVLYNGRHVTGSPFHQEIFDHQKVKLESAKTTGLVGDEMSLDGINVFISVAYTLVFTSILVTQTV